MSDQECINAIRALSADVVQKAKSGHPGAPMGCAPIAHTLWTKVMRFAPEDPAWFNRDRFVLSNGHACALQYIMLHLSGYPLSIEDLQSFRQLHSKTPGHPENFVTDGIEVSTGPLGQGLSNAVGMCIAEAHLAATFNKPGFSVIDNYTYVLCGDGCLQEGVTSEASSLAGHLGLGKLIVLYDDNQITIDGSTDLSFSEDVVTRYQAYGWHTQHVPDGDDNVDAILAAIEVAKAETERPSMIKVTTTIGFGSAKQGSAKVHGAPLGPEDIQQLKQNFGLNPDESFAVPAAVADTYRRLHGRAHSDEWHALMDNYSAEFPAEAADLRRRIAGELPEDWASCLPCNSAAEPDKFPSKATRQHSENVLNCIAAVVPEMIGGSADLTPSNLTNLKSSFDFQRSGEGEPPTKKPKLSGGDKGSYAGRYLRFGVREHAMGGYYHPQGFSNKISDAPDSTFQDGMITDTAISRIQRYANESLAAESRGETNKPFFIAVGLHKPHIPWVMPQRFLDQQLPLDQTDIAKRGVPPENYCNASLYICDNLYKGLPWDPAPVADQQDHRRKYRAAVSWTDFNVGRLLQAVEQAGLSESTAVVFHGDHGWHLGEQGGWCKQSNFDLVARVPLVMYVPWLSQSHGKQSAALVEIVDLFPTTLDLFNITDRVRDADELEGVSFLPLLKDPTTAPSGWKNATFTQYPRCRPAEGQEPWVAPSDNACTGVDSGSFDAMGYSIRSDQYRYTLWLKWDGTRKKVAGWAKDNVVGEELYDHAGDDGLDTDKYDNVNLGCDGPHASVCAIHKEALIAGWKTAKPKVA